MRFLWILATLPALAGCLGMDNLESWKGHSAADLIYAWGPPDKQEKLPDGRSVLSYSHSHAIEGTSYDCEATFRINASGTVEETDAEGNIGGCNRLLLSKTKAK